jgi:hypothetical protein
MAISGGIRTSRSRLDRTTHIATDLLDQVNAIQQLRHFNCSVQA